MHNSHDATEQTALTPKRIEALHDGVFAIVMTLLILELKIPEVHDSEHLHAELLALLPIVISYVITFVNLGIYWVGQQIQFHFIERSDRAFSWIHVLFLMLVSVLPFSSALLGHYPSDQIVSILYGLNLIAIGLVSYGSWRYATHHHRLTVHTIDDTFVKKVNRRILAAPVAALIAILLSFVSMTGSLLVYLLIVPYYIFPGRVDRFWRQEAVPHTH